jgi:hypothetical protein
MQYEWRTYKDKEVLYVNYSLLTQDQIIEQILAIAAILRASENKILLLTDYRDTPVTMRVVKEVEEVGRTVFRHKTLRSATLGITGIKKLLLKTYNSLSGDNIIPFDNYEEAVNYLIENKG